MEICGGDATTSRLVVKVHGLHVSPSSAQEYGFDLSTNEGVAALWTCLRAVKPWLVLMVPPCSGLKGTSALHAATNPHSWLSRRDQLLPLPRLASQVAQYQLDHGRHFLLEQPQGSAMFDMMEWKRLLRDPQVDAVTFNQCQVGLSSSPHGAAHPVSRSRTLVGSSQHSLWRFRALTSPQTGHLEANTGVCQGPFCRVAETVHVASGSVPMLAAASVFDLICSVHDDRLLSYVRFDCPGCRGYFRKDHPRHVRRGDCKFPDVEEWSLSCEGCLSHRHRGHSSHTLDERCQWPLIAERPGAARERRGHHPRDGRRPASEDPTASVRLDGPGPAPPSSGAAGRIPSGDGAGRSPDSLCDAMDAIGQRFLDDAGRASSSHPDPKALTRPTVNEDELDNELADYEPSEYMPSDHEREQGSTERAGRPRRI